MAAVTDKKILSEKGGIEQRKRSKLRRMKRQKIRVQDSLKGNKIALGPMNFFAHFTKMF